MTPPRRGRPTDAPKTAIVRIRATMAEKARWVAISRKSGATLSDWLRNLANEK